MTISPILAAPAFCLMKSGSRRLAVLIDGDSLNPAFLGRVLAEAVEHGTVAIRRIYGNKPKLSAWEGCIRRHKIEAVPNHTGGKNVADVVMTIHAVEILRSRRKIDGFCIVASDNDFAGLANWLRWKGIFVMGIGSSSTPPEDFERECDVFKYVEKLPQSDNPSPAAQKALSGWKRMVKKTLRKAPRKNDWVLLSKVGSELKEDKPGMNLRDYCHGDLLSLVKSSADFEVKESESGETEIRLANA